MDKHVTDFYTEEAGNYHAVRYGSWYGRLFAHLHHTVLRGAVRMMRPGGRVLDVATGTGHSLDVLQHAGGDRVATDLTLEMLRTCRGRLDPASGIRYVLADALRLPFPDASFDLVNSSRFLHLLPKSLQQAAVAEMCRVLRPGGILVVDFYNRSHWTVFALPIACYRALRRKRPTGDTLNSPGEVLSWIEGNRLETVRLAGIGSYGLILLRPFGKAIATRIGERLAARWFLPCAEQFAIVARKV